MRSLFCGFVLFVLFVVPSRGAEPTYWDDARPILRKHCTFCHSTKNIKEAEVSGGLALDTYEAVVKGKAVRVGKSAESKLIERLITKDTEKRMPLGVDPLPEEKIAVLRRWLVSGATAGTRPAETTPVVSTPARKLDLTIPTAHPARLEVTMKVGPLSPITAVAFSPDAKLLATGCYRLVTVWDLTTVKPVRALTNVLGAVNDLRFSPDGKVLAVAGGQPSAKGDLRLYDTTEWKLLATLPGHDDVVFGVAFSPDGKKLASAGFDKTVRIWDMATHKLERTLTGHSDFVYAVAFGPDGKWVVSVSKDRAVKMVEVETGKGLRTFSGPDQDVMAVAVSPDGKAIVSSGLDTALIWWNPETGERIRTLGGHGVAVHELSFSKDGKTLLSAAGDRTVRLWDGASGAPGQSINVGSLTYAARISDDRKLVASGSFDGLVRVWETATGRQLLTLLAVPAEKDADWLAITPEGYAVASPGLSALGRWRMNNQPLPSDVAWKALGNAEAMVKAVHGEKVAPPTVGK